MGWQEGDTWQWWLQHGFDGIAGGLLGGVVAGGVAWWAVRRTIGHERELEKTRRADESAVRAEEALERSWTELRTAVNKLQTTATRISMTRSHEKLEAVWQDLFADVGFVDALARKLSPALSEDLVVFMQLVLARRYDNAETVHRVLENFCTILQQRLLTWLREPEGFTVWSRQQWLAAQNP